MKDTSSRLNVLSLFVACGQERFHCNNPWSGFTCIPVRFHLQVCEMQYCLDTPPQIAYSAILSIALALTSCRHASHLETCALAFHKGLTLHTEHAGSDTLSLTQDHTRTQNALRHSEAMELQIARYRCPSSATPVKFCNGNTTPMS